MSPAMEGNAVGLSGVGALLAAVVGTAVEVEVEAFVMTQPTPGRYID